MSRKLDFIPKFNNYQEVIKWMDDDFNYRKEERTEKTYFGNPLYYRINCQVIVTKQCPYNCPFCIEKQNPMNGKENFEKQIESFKKVLKIHPQSRVSITGGEPSLFINQLKNLIQTYKENCDQVFMAINSTLYNKEILQLDKDIVINVSINDYVNPDKSLFDKRCCYQTILNNSSMTLTNIKNIIENNLNISNFSFRFLTDINKSDYNIAVFNEIREAKDIKIGTFRVGDFFVYLTFNYKGKKCRITLGDMCRQQKLPYEEGYSNIIIHPDGNITTNWK